jgi:hypothetical protein
MKVLSVLLLCMASAAARGASILVPMDEAQKNHLKAYGIAYHTLSKGIPVDWLLNYRGGSFLFEYSADLESECRVRNVSYEVKPDAEAAGIRNLVSSPSQNMNGVRMERVARIAVYSPKNDLIQDENDAVILALDYAEIPYDLIYDEEVLRGDLARYDWIHLHHEDFTGQVSKGRFRPSAVMEAKNNEMLAARLGFEGVPQLKYKVMTTIHAFCAGGGYLFAMCSGAETFDVALAAGGADIEQSFSDGGSIFLDYAKTLAFENFELLPPDERSFSDINVGRSFWEEETDEYFSLYTFSAKWDVIPTLLTQNHETSIREFRGLTTAFNKALVKPTIDVLAESRSKPEVRYLYGEMGQGHWAYYSGHDPEGYRGGGGRGGRRTTDLSLYPDSPGYRLILNNVLFPSAGKKKRKT